MARDQQDRTQVRRIAVNVVVEVVVLAILAAVLWTTSYNALLSTQRGNAALKLETAQEHIDIAAENGRDTLQSFDETQQGTVGMLAYFYQRNDATDAQLAAMADEWGLLGLALVDASGAVAAHGGDVAFDEGAQGWDALIADGTPFTADGVRYYAASAGSSQTVVAAVDYAQVDALAASDSDLSVALGDISVGENGYVLAIDESDGTVAYDRDASLVGTAADRLFSEVPTPGFDGFTDFGGERYYVQAVSDGDYLLCTMVAESEFTSNTLNKVVAVVVAFAAISILIVCYCQFLYTDARSRSRSGAPSDGSYVRLGKRLILDRAFAKKCLPILVVGTIGVFCVSWYTQTLLSLSTQIVHNDNKIATIEEALADNAAAADELESAYSAEYVDLADGIAHLLAADPRLVDDAHLEALAELSGLESIFVFDGDGKTVSTNTRNKNFSLPEDESDQSYAFWDVVSGVEPSHVQMVVWDGGAGVTFYAGVERLDADGMVEVGVSSQTLAERMAATEFTNEIATTPVGNGGFLVAVDGSDGTVTYLDDAGRIGTAASALGLTDAALADGYLGYQTVDGTPCLVSTAYVEGQYVLVCIPTARIGAGDLANSAITALLSFVLLLPVVAQLVVRRRPGGSGAQAPQGGEGIKAQPRGSFDRTTAGGVTRRVQSVTGRWDFGSGLPWGEKTPEGKLGTLVKGLLLVLIAAVLLYIYVFGATDNSSALAYIMSLRWEKLPNIFSLSHIGIVVLTAAVAVWLARIVIALVFRNLNTRLETVGRLLASFVKYAAAIAVLFYSLSLIGVDAASLWASAGIVTLVVGLGAQSLIKDVIAGIFLAFEGEFRVGDIVTVGGWTGTVIDIGIRTTKIEDGNQNIKILNNSAIADVVNMTKKYSFAVVDLSVSFETPLERFEALLNRELPHIAERLPKIVSGPFYKGVVSVGDTALVVRVIAQCEESDRGQLSRDLTRQLLLLCDHNDVAPYKGAGCDDEAESEATSDERREAALFVKEQDAQAGHIFLGEHKEDEG